MPGLKAGCPGPRGTEEEQGEGLAKVAGCEGLSPGSLRAWGAVGLQEQGARGSGAEKVAAERWPHFCLPSLEGGEGVWWNLPHFFAIGWSRIGGVGDSARGKQMEIRPPLETQTLPAWPKNSF